MNILPFSQIQDDHLDLVGGKGLSIAKLLQAKLMVPEGFVVTSKAFKAFLEEHDIQVAIKSELQKVTVHDLHSIDYASRLIQELILSAEIHTELATGIMQQYTHSNSNFIATRSSVHSNHGQALSWTGQLATYLHISPEDILYSVKQCWASLFSAKSLFYLLQHELDPESVSLAVIVQRMIDSRIAGICYSAHPVSKDKNQFVVEAGIGLGDANEDRPFTPDTYVVQRDPFKILDKNISTQKVEVISLGGTGTSVQDIEPEQGSKQKMSDEDIKILVEQVQKAEEAFGGPVMIEWVQGEELYLLQARKMD